MSTAREPSRTSDTFLRRLSHAANHGERRGLTERRGASRRALGRAASEVLGARRVEAAQVPVAVAARAAARERPQAVGCGRGVRREGRAGGAAHRGHRRVDWHSRRVDFGRPGVGRRWWHGRRGDRARGLRGAGGERSGESEELAHDASVSRRARKRAERSERRNVAGGEVDGVDRASDDRGRPMLNPSDAQSSHAGAWKRCNRGGRRSRGAGSSGTRKGRLARRRRPVRASLGAVDAHARSTTSGAWSVARTSRGSDRTRLPRRDARAPGSRRRGRAGSRCPRG